MIVVSDEREIEEGGAGFCWGGFLNLKGTSTEKEKRRFGGSESAFLCSRNGLRTAARGRNLGTYDSTAINEQCRFSIEMTSGTPAGHLLDRVV